MCECTPNAHLGQQAIEKGSITVTRQRLKREHQLVLGCRGMSRRFNLAGLANLPNNGERPVEIPVPVRMRLPISLAPLRSGC